MLFLSGNVEFCTARTRFLDHPSTGGEATAKIYVKVSLKGLELPMLAQVDTAAPWSVVDPDTADAIGLKATDEPVVEIDSRLGKRKGFLLRTDLTILADEGPSLDVEATVFVPNEWPAGRNFIGYGGLLDRIRIALDPATNDFFFGECK